MISKQNVGDQICQNAQSITELLFALTYYLDYPFRVVHQHFDAFIFAKKQRRALLDFRFDPLTLIRMQFMLLKSIL